MRPKIRGEFKGTNSRKLLTFVSWSYQLFLMVDANFRLKLKDRGTTDIHLGPGWAYVVEDSKYRSHIAEFATDAPEVRFIL